MLRRYWLIYNMLTKQGSCGSMQGRLIGDVFDTSLLAIHVNRDLSEFIRRPAFRSAAKASPKIPAHRLAQALHHHHQGHWLQN